MPFSLGWINVKDYGAVGDGTIDDTSAISTAIAALPSPGVLYFPPGTYKTSGGFTISTPCVVIGVGGGGGESLDYDGGGGTVPHISQITCTSQTAILFAVTASGVQFHDLSLVNTYAGTPTSTSTAIKTYTTAGDHAQYTGLTVSKFYINIDHAYGREWMIERCYFLDPVLEGLRIQNLDATDECEVTITNCHFREQLYAADAAIRFVNCGGYRISDCAFLGDGTADNFQVMVKVTGGTSNLLIVNCSMENYRDTGIYIDASTTSQKIIITAIEMTDGRTTAKEGIVVVSGRNVTITGCILQSFGVAYTAVRLTTVANAVLTGNMWENYTAFLGGTGQTNVNVASNYEAT